ncbi:MAG: thiopurine S-methyltransferase [Pseudomonadales bacterium]|mgnify:CR=1 FL=1|jgi:thiopurine S-methyltransferase|nr:thiopurine S-methyltransferase [Pseudomonadales bacterium]MDP6471933.1 thiopurine S-methyltransferase [Pseudomonadales bacterium]MDP6826797.1 thiopurine S-methyltransferase [Pseudomonadales bacterium]MDP6970925.1 thiopurine S-methyltransferase [Pseudomonadales bacterium]|tara:strand:- start:602 stop:1282 length:681 start_codon:yes stop_codon:yes gene_type:complete
MKEEFWLERWTSDRLGWHQEEYNAWLTKYWPRLDLNGSGAVFVPLCGKSLDMHWLRAQGHPVRGVEFVTAAIEDFFAEASLDYDYVEDFFGGVPCYSHGDADNPNYRIYRSDFFELSTPHLYRVVGTFDRGALVALPPGIREIYADHLQRIIPDHSEILLLTLEYDQQLVEGPPFCVTEEEVNALFAERCSVERLEEVETDRIPSHFPEHDISSATEGVYRIVKNE